MELTRMDVERRVRGIFADLFDVDPDALTTDSSPDSIAKWDSLQHLNLVGAIESEFGVALSDEDVIEMLSFGLVVEIVSTAANR